jgi:hypothetical protein
MQLPLLATVHCEQGAACGSLPQWLLAALLCLVQLTGSCSTQDHDTSHHSQHT